MDLIEAGRDKVVVRFSRDELGTLANALNEILRGPYAIEDWEFQTRFGSGREEATGLLSAISALSVDSCLRERP